MTFSDRLRALIEENGLTQKELSKQLKIPASTFGGYVQGTSEPDFQTLKIIASYFGVSLDYLLDYQYSQKKSSNDEDVLRVFRCLSLQQQKIYIDQGKSFLRIARLVNNSKDNN